MTVLSRTAIMLAAAAAAALLAGCASAQSSRPAATLFPQQTTAQPQQAVSSRPATARTRHHSAGPVSQRPGISPAVSTPNPSPTPGAIQSTDKSLLVATQITAIATAVLAFFAIVTACFAIAAFSKQREEVNTLKRQLDEQAREAGVMEQQLKAQQDLNEKQTPVLELQARELTESIAERLRDREQRRRDQASRVFITEQRFSRDPDYTPGGFPSKEEIPESIGRWIVVQVENTSDQPVSEAQLNWHIGNNPAPGDNPQWLGIVPPREQAARQKRKVPDGAGPGLFGATLQFRDAAGVTWHRGPDGQLDEYPSAQ